MPKSARGNFIFLFLLALLFNGSVDAQAINIESVLTRDEINWLNNNKQGIRYAINPAWPPAAYIEDGAPKGFIASYIGLFEEMLGIRFIHVSKDTWTDVLDGLRDNEIDLVGGIQKTGDRDYLLFTLPVKTIQAAVITKTSYPFSLTTEHINSMKLACVKNAASTAFIRQTYPGAKITLVENELEALLLAAYGNADGAVSAIMTASYLVEKYGITNLKNGASIDFQWNIGFATPAGMPELNGIIGKLLQQIDEEQHKEIFAEHVNLNSLNTPPFLVRNKRIITLAAFILFCLLIVVFVFNFYLQKKVREKTAQLRKANNMARKNEEKYRMIAENTSDVVWLSDFNFNLSYISPSVEKMLGDTPVEHMRKDIAERVPAPYLKQLSDILNEELENEKKPEFNKDRSRFLELELFHANGSKVWVEMNISFVRTSTGQPSGLHGDMRNITGKVNARRYIQKRLAMEKLLAEVSRNAISENSLDKTLRKILRKAGLALDVSRAYIFRYDNRTNSIINAFEWCAEGIGHRTDSNSQQPCGLSWLCSELKKGNVVNYKYTGKIPDEQTRKMLHRNKVVSLLSVPLLLKEKFYGYIGFDECRNPKKWNNEDVKVLQSLAVIVASLIERNKTEKELIIKDRSIELSLVAKSIADLQGNITYVNPTFLKYWRYDSLEEVLNASTHSFWVPGSDLGKVINSIVQTGSWKGEMKAMRSDGSRFDALVQASLVTDSKGKPLCMEASIFDITDRKIWERELLDAKEKAEESNRLKSAFLTNMSHEIRTPMNGILGFLNLLKEVNISGDEKQEFVERVNESGQRLLNTVNDIFESAIIEAGETTLHYEEINLPDLIHSCLSFFKPEAERKNIGMGIVNKVPAELINTDKYKLERILHNLLSNAVKFTGQGYIEFGAEIKGTFIEFYVKDSGAGIPEEQADKIFGPFIQADMSLTRKYEGTGLGLSITKAYVEKLGGKIWFKNNISEGTTFWFTIPFNPGHTDALQPAFNQAMTMNRLLQGRKILIAEDDRISFLLLEISLKKLGAEIIHTESGEETVQALLEHPEICLVLMDIKMRGMNGIEAARRIRSMNVKVPIIAQTALAFAEDHQKALDAGCNEHITKPIDRDLLLEKIKKYLN